MLFDWELRNLFIKYFMFDDKIKYDCQYGNAEIGWSDFYVVKKTKKTYYLFLSKNQALIVPKKHLSQQQEIMLVEIIKKYKLKKRKNKRGKYINHNT